MRPLRLGVLAALILISVGSGLSLLGYSRSTQNITVTTTQEFSTTFTMTNTATTRVLTTQGTSVGAVTQYVSEKLERNPVIVAAETTTTSITPVGLGPTYYLGLAATVVGILLLILRRVDSMVGGRPQSNATAKRCNRCGSQLVSGARFCMYCGWPTFQDYA